MPEGDTVRRAAERLHLALAGRELSRAELRWPGTIEMGLGVVKFGRTSVTFDQVVFSEGICVASAQSVSVLLDEATRKPTPLTEGILASFQRWLRRGMDGR